MKFCAEFPMPTESAKRKKSQAAESASPCNYVQRSELVQYRYLPILHKWSYFFHGRASFGFEDFPKIRPKIGGKKKKKKRLGT